MVTLWSLKPFKALFAAGGPLASDHHQHPVPMLDKLVAKMPPVVAQATPTWRGVHLQLAGRHWHRHPDCRRP